MSQRLGQDKDFAHMRESSYFTMIKGETKMSTTSLIPSLNYFILRESSRAKLSQVDFLTKCNPEKNRTKSEPSALKRAISEPNLIMDRTDCFCSIDKKYKSLRLFKKRFNIFISSFNLIKFLKYVITFRHCRMSNQARKRTRKRATMGRSISLDWIDKKTFLIYKVSHQLSKRSKLKNPNEKNKKKYSDCKTLSIKSMGSLTETENGPGNTSRSHSCFTPYSTNISLKASLANLNRIKHHDILEEAILNLNEIGGVTSFFKSFKKSESKRSFLSFRSINYDSKRKKNSSCLSINDKIDLRDYVDKKSEISDNVLHRFLENKRANARRFAICARIDKLDHNKELINFMEYLLREDYIQNFLM